MRPLPPIDFPSKEIYYNFMKPGKTKGPKAAGRAMQAKMAVRLVEEAIKQKKHARWYKPSQEAKVYGKRGRENQTSTLMVKKMLKRLGL